jgi:hypothetical protein
LRKFYAYLKRISSEMKKVFLLGKVSIGVEEVSF